MAGSAVFSSCGHNYRATPADSFYPRRLFTIIGSYLIPRRLAGFAISIRLFTEKLREKNQSEDQRQHAANAISLYFDMQGLEAHAPSVADEPNQQSSVTSVESDQPREPRSPLDF